MKRGLMNQRQPDGYVRFDAAGTYTWNVPSNVYSVELFMVGGGGGGGRSLHAGGGGGGGGEIVLTTVPVTPRESITVIVGNGGMSGYPTGAAYTCNIGTNGGDSSFGSIVAHGGYCGGVAYDAYSGRAGAGGSKYQAGGNGGQPPRFGITYPTAGKEGITYDGEVFGSGGGAGGANEGKMYSYGTQGGTNAGRGYSIVEDREEVFPDYPLTYAKDGYGGGGGSGDFQASVRNGGCGCVIIKYKHGK